MDSRLGIRIKRLWSEEVVKEGVIDITIFVKQSTQKNIKRPVMRGIGIFIVNKKSYNLYVFTV